MQARKYLKQIHYLNIRIEDYKQDIIRLEAIATHITPTLSDMKVQVSIDDNKVANAVIDIADTKRELAVMVSQMIDLARTITNQINMMENENAKNFLYKVYVQCKPFSVVAYEMGYSVAWCKKNHKKFLTLFESVYPNIP